MMVSTPESITLDPTMHAKSATKYIVINHPKWLITSDPYDRKWRKYRQWILRRVNDSSPKKNTKQFMGDVGPSLESCKDFVKWSPHVPHAIPFRISINALSTRVFPAAANSLPEIALKHNSWYPRQVGLQESPTKKVQLFQNGTIKLNGRLNNATQVRVESKNINKQDTRNMAP